VLAAELSHRVKNTLAVVSSIAERTLPDNQAKMDLIGRFHALGHTHDFVVTSRLGRGTAARFCSWRSSPRTPWATGAM